MRMWIFVLFKGCEEKVMKFFLSLKISYRQINKDDYAMFGLLFDIKYSLFSLNLIPKKLSGKYYETATRFKLDGWDPHYYNNEIPTGFLLFRRNT
jgi:hypothetical protein